MSKLSQEVELFRELDPAELERLETIAEQRKFAPGDVIVRQGHPADAIGVVKKGSVRVTAILADGREAGGAEEEMLVRLGPGEFFGELSFITGKPPALSVIAEEDAEVALLPHARLHALIGADASICRKLLFAVTRTLVDRLTRTGRELVLARYFLRGA